jgi:hypothetical protein
MNVERGGCRSTRSLPLFSLEINLPRILPHSSPHALARPPTCREGTTNILLAQGLRIRRNGAGLNVPGTPRRARHRPVFRQGFRFPENALVAVIISFALVQALDHVLFTLRYGKHGPGKRTATADGLFLPYDSCGASSRINCYSCLSS